MATTTTEIWVECNDGHTKLSGLSVDGFPISDICKYTGIIRSVLTEHQEVRDEG